MSYSDPVFCIVKIIISGATYHFILKLKPFLQKTGILSIVTL